MRYRIHPLLAEVVRRRLAAGGVDVEQARGTVLRAVRADLARGEIARVLRPAARRPARRGRGRPAAPAGRGAAGPGRAASLQEFVRHHPRGPARQRPTRGSRWPSSAGRPTTCTARWAGSTSCVEDGTGGGRARRRGRLRAADARPPRLRLADRGRRPGPGRWSRTSAFTERSGHLLPRLLCELGTDQAWLGDLDAAEETLGEAIQLGRASGLTNLVATALAQLAFTLYMQGHERAAARTATRALAAAGTAPPCGGTSSAAARLGPTARHPGGPAVAGCGRGGRGRARPAALRRHHRRASGAGCVMPASP